MEIIDFDYQTLFKNCLLTFLIVYKSWEQNLSFLIVVFLFKNKYLGVIFRPQIELHSK